MASFTIHLFRHENPELISCAFSMRHLRPDLSVNVILSGTENKCPKGFDADTWRIDRHEKSRRTLEDNIKIELKEFVLDGVDWIYVADDSDKWWSALTREWTLRCHKMRGTA